MLKLVHIFYILQNDRTIGSNWKLLKCFFLKVEETLSCFLSASCGDQAGIVSCHIMCPNVCLESQLDGPCKNLYDCGELVSL